MLPSFFPCVDLKERTLQNGTVVAACAHCVRKFTDTTICTQYYESLSEKRDGFYQCPFGFTTRVFSLGAARWAITGVVAHPRFGDEQERRRAKAFPEIKTTRQAIDANVEALRKIEEYRDEVVEAAARVLPQAFHELRKLNAAVLQHAERDLQARGESRSVHSIRSAAELMRNNFEILEALANIEGLKALPNDSTINLFDLLFKMKRVYQERAAQTGMSILVEGSRALFYGSQKSFPIVPTVLLENAIKYGIQDGKIRADIAVRDNKIRLTIENNTERKIDPIRCFDKGVRFVEGGEGGGYGLYIAKEVVRCHKGTISCELLPGVVRMVVELPLYKVI
jgi:signal transduction histidine kinase